MKRFWTTVNIVSPSPALSCRMSPSFRRNCISSTRPRPVVTEAAVGIKGDDRALAREIFLPVEGKPRAIRQLPKMPHITAAPTSASEQDREAVT